VLEGREDFRPQRDGPGKRGYGTGPLAGGGENYGKSTPVFRRRDKNSQKKWLTQTHREEVGEGNKKSDQQRVRGRRQEKAIGVFPGTEVY